MISLSSQPPFSFPLLFLFPSPPPFSFPLSTHFSSTSTAEHKRWRMVSAAVFFSEAEHSGSGGERHPGPIISSSFRFRAKLSHPQLSTIPLGHLVPIRRNVKCAAATGSNGHRSGLHREPFWLSMTRDVAGSLRSLAIFLVEQPGQLKYIEWPTFQSTLKTATLTLVLVALLIVALTSIDSSLCYILALLLRKPA